MRKLRGTRWSSSTVEEGNKPFFVWWNPTRMHIWTHLKKESQGTTGLGLYPDGMVEHDDDGRSASRTSSTSSASPNNTIVIYGTDNGAESVTLAGRRDHAIPRREGTDVGRRLFACRGSCAGPE